MGRKHAKITIEERIIIINLHKQCKRLSEILQIVNRPRTTMRRRRKHCTCVYYWNLLSWRILFTTSPRFLPLYRLPYTSSSFLSTCDPYYAFIKSNFPGTLFSSTWGELCYTFRRHDASLKKRKRKKKLLSQVDNDTANSARVSVLVKKRNENEKKKKKDSIRSTSTNEKPEGREKGWR